jgi:glutamine cyclotransferase
MGLSKKKQLSVVDGGKPLRAINELEFVDGYIYANVWMQDFIVQIDSMGRVISKFDFGPYAPPLQGSAHSLAREACLNGVAFNTSTGDRFIVTGKLWPQYYTVQLSIYTVSDRARGGMERMIMFMICAIIYITYKAFNKRA